MAKKKDIQLLNLKIKNCYDCTLSETRRNSICGEGNLDAQIMLIAQAPGRQEDHEGKMFIGPSGRVLNDLLKRANIKRQDVYMTNLIKCMLPKYRKPKVEEIKQCQKYLEKEIEIIEPQVLVPLGFIAIKFIFKKYDIEIPHKDNFSSIFGNLHLVNNKKVLPLPHPAALLHNPSYKEETEKHYEKLLTISKDCKWYRACPIKRYYEQGIIPKVWIELYCKGDWLNCVRFHMEEEGRYHPDEMLPDGTLINNRRKNN
jgi:uracil-DNA glycosylase family 4